MDIRKDFEQLQRKIDRLQYLDEKKLVRNYAVVLNDIRGILGEIFAKYKEVNYTELSKYNRLKSIERDINFELAKLYKDNSNLIKSSLKTIYLTSFNTSKNIVEEASKRTIRGVIKDEVIQKSIQNPISGLTLNERLSRNRSNIIFNIKQQLTQGLIRGESYKQMSDRIKGSLEQDTSKAVRIARTESHRVMEASKVDSLKNASNQGVKMTKTWVSSRDEKVRSSHERLDGTTIPYEEDFVNRKTGGKGPAPGQMGTPEDDINCRCIFVVNVI